MGKRKRDASKYLIFNNENWKGKLRMKKEKENNINRRWDDRRIVTSLKSCRQI
jgi:hypothetical protein